MSKLTNWLKIRGIVFNFTEKAFMLSHFRQFKFSQEEYKETKKSLMAWVEREALPELETITKSLYYTKGNGSALLTATIELKKLLKCYFELSACMTDDSIRKEIFSIHEALLLDAPLEEKGEE